MRLSWPVCRYGGEARLLYCRLGPLRLLGDLRHLAAWWLAWLAELGGLGRLCGLHGLGRLCRLCRLSGLQGITFRRGALGLGGKRKGQSESVRHNTLPPTNGPRAPGRVSCRHLLSARPTEGV